MTLETGSATDEYDSGTAARACILADTIADSLDYLVSRQIQ